jgi:threonine synthase
MSSTNTNSALSHLECTYCHQTYDAGQLYNTCLACGKVLYARYDLKQASQTLTKEVLQTREASMWRYREMLPVKDNANIVSLGEGFTPLLSVARLAQKLGLNQLWVKDEGQNPTGSFKARGMAAAVSKAKELGVTAFGAPSAGNAGGALAAYAARAGLAATIIMPEDAPQINKLEAAAAGAQVYLVRGLINDAGRIVRDNAVKHGWFDLSTLKEPYRAEGKKTMGYELAEQLGWRLPDVIIYPAGGGTGLVGMWKAFAEMEALGWIGAKRPKMVVVQAEGCAPIVRAFQEGTEFAQPWENAQTEAAGLRVPVAIGDYLMLQAIRESNGTAVTASDAESFAAEIELTSREGVFAAPEGAATLVALQKLIANGFVNPSDEVVLFNTGSGIKYPEVLHFDLPVLSKDQGELA